VNLNGIIVVVVTNRKEDVETNTPNGIIQIITDKM
jgi:hypothetical protein